MSRIYPDKELSFVEGISTNPKPNARPHCAVCGESRMYFRKTNQTWRCPICNNSPKINRG